MNELTVLGAGTAGVTLVSAVKELKPSLEVKLIDVRDYYVEKKSFFSFAPKEELDLKEWSKNKNVDFIQDKVEAVSAKRRKIYFKESQTLEFGTLVVATGLISKKVSLKGEQKEGFFYLSDINLNSVRDLLKVSGEVTVYASTILGVKLSLSLSALGKEVHLVSGGLDFLLGDEKRVSDLLKQEGVTCHFGASVEKTIGESRIKAVKIFPLKVFASQLIFMDSGFLPNYGFFEEEISLKDTFFTGYENLYFVGDVTRKDISSEFFFPFNHKETLRQSHILSDYLLTGKVPVPEIDPDRDRLKQRAIEEIFDFASKESPSANC